MSTALTPSLSNYRAQPQRPLSHQVFGMLLFIATEFMFFAALVSAYLIVKAGAVDAWPPADQPRLPVGITAVNTGILLLSGVLVGVSARFFTAKDLKKSRHLLAAGVLLGLLFVVIQGYEWAKLISFGLTLTSSVYGACFYFVIGSHAFHAIGAVLFMAWIYFQHVGGSLNPSTFRAGQIFWYFVVGVWPVLYGLVYLS